MLAIVLALVACRAPAVAEPPGPDPAAPTGDTGSAAGSGGRSDTTTAASPQGDSGPHPADSGPHTADSGAPSGASPSCPDLVGGEPPVVVAGAVTGHGDDDAGTCGGAGEEDVSISFTAPVAGPYALSLVGSPPGSTTALLVVRDGCGGAELACRPGIREGSGGPILLDLAAGQEIVATVDGAWSQGARDYTLTFEEVPATETDCADAVDGDFDGLVDCQDPDCASASACAPTCPEFVLPATPFDVAEDESGASDDVATSCALGAMPDHTWGFVAPADGFYLFWVDDALAEHHLAIRDGDCAGVELDCGSLDYGISQVGAALTAGQTVVLVVEGDPYDGPSNGGPYTLHGSGP